VGTTGEVQSRPAVEAEADRPAHRPHYPDDLVDLSDLERALDRQEPHRRLVAKKARHQDVAVRHVLRRLAREQDPKSPFVFTSERGAPFTTAGFARMVERAGEATQLGFKAHPHMLLHACGFALANKGHDTRALQAYLGHKNIQHTLILIYTSFS